MTPPFRSDAHPRREPIHSSGLPASYILPIRRNDLLKDDELDAYLHALGSVMDVVVVDGSPAHVFAGHHRRWSDVVRHVPVDPDLDTPNGKVGGVLTGVRHAQYELLVVADDDVRYTRPELQRLLALLEDADVVRPQNYFDPLPWHARWDTARSLLNRVLGGDWPGTLAVRRSALDRTGGYRGDVLFENLEMVRTIQAAGGVERAALDLYVRRLPPTSDTFQSQRVRQAYDEFARPARLVASLAVLPWLAAAVLRRRSRSVCTGVALAIFTAECGRRRDGGSSVFPLSASLLAPLWILERGICSWLAVLARVCQGGIRYHGTVLRDAATPAHVLRAEFGGSPSRTFSSSPPSLANTTLVPLRRATSPMAGSQQHS